ncbi:MAG: hypothetical protein KBA71_00085 [Opitutaceae bacterium]|nr:hypothetical protein [Opitutaceae bacterium]
MNPIFRLTLTGCIFLTANIFSVCATTLTFKDRLEPRLVGMIPELIKEFSPETGRFKQGPFDARGQDPIYTLATVYSLNFAGNPYYKSHEILNMIIAGGDALIREQDDRGMWPFNKNGSYWGQTFMCWTYSRWIRTYIIIKADMPANQKNRWDSALRKGYESISRTELKRITNISTQLATALYMAGLAFDREDWKLQATDFLHRVIATQHKPGYWSEHLGPTVIYNYVYTDALGIYYAFSRDAAAARALERASAFHLNFTYPDGSNIETVDERNPYHAGASYNHNLGFSYSPEGRAFLSRQWDNLDWKLSADAISSYLLYGEEGPMVIPPSENTYALVEDGAPRATVTRKGPWILVMSAYTSPLVQDRWIQDRQNLVSIWHDSTKLILGGGNTKLQPAWSNFTVGDMHVLRHTPGEERPDFAPKGELYWIPSHATITNGDFPALALTYGPVQCQIALKPIDANRLKYEVSAKSETPLTVLAHLTLMPKLGANLNTSGGYRGKLESTAIELDSARLGNGMEYGDIQLELPEGTTLHWPALPHNPYMKNGHSDPKEGRIELRIPLVPNGTSKTVTLRIKPAEFAEKEAL